MSLSAWPRLQTQRSASRVSAQMLKPLPGGRMSGNFAKYGSQYTMDFLPLAEKMTKVIGGECSVLTSAYGSCTYRLESIQHPVSFEQRLSHLCRLLTKFRFSAQSVNETSPLLQRGQRRLYAASCLSFSPELPRLNMYCFEQMSKCLSLSRMPYGYGNIQPHLSLPHFCRRRYQTS